ncbi:LexA family transcriptional regulator [Pedobacter cryoconitis]|uniref:Helix-turn-helix protein n=1 Tax=Pedobacter cryoconitis TaxID=188932 RepID=A0A327T2M4_9SPHI|nr:helix-turn-helix domain-containing protein [Pedobacter cryoconitis]RAJ35398.1 helix-turn-helix protein [Pedobacter cryoconitis]
MEKTINQRFKEVVDFLTRDKIVKSKKDIALQLGISQSYLSEILNNRIKISGDFLQIFFNKFGINPNYIFGTSSDILVQPSNLLAEPQAVYSKTTGSKNDTPALQKHDTPADPPNLNFGVPKVVSVNENNEELISLVNVKAAAGYLNGYADPEYIERLPTIRMPGIKGGSHRAFEIRGHSMSPTMHNSSIAIGRWVESFDDIRDRYVYIVITSSEGIVMKRVLNRIHETGKLILLSDNQNKREYPNIILDVSDVLEVWKLRAGFIFEFPEPGELYNRFNDLEAKVSIMQDQMLRMFKP